jgi:hypothetical protein
MTINAFTYLPLSLSRLIRCDDGKYIYDDYWIIDQYHYAANRFQLAFIQDSNWIKYVIICWRPNFMFSRYLHQYLYICQSKMKRNERLYIWVHNSSSKKIWLDIILPLFHVFCMLRNVIQKYSLMELLRIWLPSQPYHQC